MMTRLVRVTEGLSGKAQLIEEDKVFDLIDNNKDWYKSKFYFDFDNENLEKAKQDALKLIQRIQKYNINPDDFEIYFSGSKGFEVTLNINKELSPKQVQSIANELAGDLESFDSSMYDANQIFRIPGTKHQKSGLYKIPLKYNELLNWG